VALAHDLSSRVLTTYVAIFGVVLAGLAFGLGRRTLLAPHPRRRDPSNQVSLPQGVTSGSDSALGSGGSA
jgi:hypothetical protein